MIEKIQIVHNDFRESLERMPFESIGRLFMALIAYADDEDYSEILGDDVQAQILFPTIKAHIIRQEDFRQYKVEAGRKGGKMGGAPIGNQNASKTKQNKAKQSKTKQIKAPIPNPIPNPNPIKNIYGTAKNVLLTDEEFSKIKSKGYEDLIEELSLYMASKNKKYADHYMTVLAWGRKREKESSPVVKMNQFTSGATNTTYDFAELEAKLVKN